jgi:hypothetical protein
VGTGGGGPPASVPSASLPSAALPSASVPTAQDPSAIADAAKQEAAQGTNPITGQPLEIDPETGQPYPIDPTTGEAVKDAGQPETMTVQQGDNTIEMSEPDQHGKMDIKIDDGHGDAKDFKLDWGDGTTGQGGVPGDPAQQAGVPAQPDPAQQTGTPAQPGVPPGADTTYQPGPDGKIHIDDGNLEITAERPQGPDGPTVVTVDDGTGKPVTYTLGGDDAQAPGTAGQQNGVLGGDPASPGTAADPGTGAQAVSTPVANTDAAQAVNAPTGDPGSGFAAPGGIDADHALGADGTGATSTDPAGAAGDTGQQTTPASAAGAFTSPETGVGGFGGTLGDGLSLDAGAQAAVGGLDGGAQTGVALDPGAPGALGQPVHAAVGIAPAGTVDPVMGGQQAALGGSGFGGSGSSGMGMMGGMGGMSGGGGGEDQERGSRAYRVDGGIFNTRGAGGRISGSLDDGGDQGDREAR